MKDPLQLTIPGFSLRHWQAEDAPCIARYANNPRIASCMRNGFPSPYTLNDAQQFIARAGNTGNFFFAIVVCGEAAGGIGIHRLDDVYSGTAEIGYWLGEPFWGKGICTAAVRAVVPVAFGIPGIIRLQGGVFADNPASMRVLEKAGFIREAVHRNAVTKNGKVMDEVLYALIKEKFEKI